MDWGLFDTRFWNSDPDIYKPFYSGVYTCGVDLEPGAYDVEVKGGINGSSMFSIYPSYEAYEKNEGKKSSFLKEKDKGFHFVIKQGEVIETRISCRNGMRIKKSD